MTNERQTGTENSPEHFARSASELYALLTAPFERQFEPFGYVAHLGLYVPRIRPIHNQDKQNDFEFITGQRIDPERIWDLELGYIPETDSIGIHNLTMPVISSNNESLVMKRMLDGSFIPVIKSLDGSTRLCPQPIAKMDDMLNPMSDGSSSIFSFENTKIESILFDAGYFMPELYKSPDDLQLRIISMLDSSQRWTVQETIESMMNGQTQIMTHRNLSQRTSGASTIKGTGRSSRPRAARLSSQADISIETTIEDLVQPGEERKQLVILFDGEDYSVSRPRVLRRTLQFDTSDTTIANFGEGQYKVAHEKEEILTASILDKLLSYLVDQMIGN